MKRQAEVIPYPEFDEIDAEGREEARDITICVDGNRRYVVSFYALGMLENLLIAGERKGKPWFSEPRMILLRRVDLNSMRRAVDDLVEQGYFDDLTPEQKE